MHNVLRKRILIDRPALTILGCALAVVAFAAPVLRDSTRNGPVANPLMPTDTVGRPPEIYNYSATNIGAIRAVVRTSREFDRLWMTLRRDTSEAPPRIDFSRDMVIVAGMGWESGAGYRISVASVLDTAHVLDIRVDLDIPTAACTSGYPAIDHPAVMVRVPQSLSTAIFLDRLHRSC